MEETLWSKIENLKGMWVFLWFVQAIGGSLYFGGYYFLGFILTMITFGMVAKPSYKTKGDSK